MEEVPLETRQVIENVDHECLIATTLHVIENVNH
jgi:hypothetical protein